MALDFRPSLEKRVAALSPNTPATRQKFYDEVRRLLLAEIRAAAPNISITTSVERQRALEAAIIDVEREAKRHDPPLPPPPPEPARPRQRTPEAEADVADTVQVSVEPAAEAKTQVSDTAPSSEVTPAPQPVSPAEEGDPAEAEPPAPVEPAPVDDAPASPIQAPSVVPSAETVEDDEVIELPETAPAERRRPVVVYAVTVATAIVAILAALTVGGLFDQPSAPVAQQRPVAAAPPVGTVRPSRSGAELIAGSAFSNAAQDAYKEGSALLARGDLDRAITAFDDSIRLDPSRPAAYGNRAFAHWRKGAVEPAIRDYTEAIRLDPANTTNRMSRAVALNRAGEYRAAIADLDEVLRAEPSNASALNSRCWARALLGELEEALLDCNQAVRLVPKDAHVLDSRGFVHLKAGRLGRAVADYDSAVRLDPKLASALYGRGLAKIGRGDRGGGNEDVNAARVLDPAIQTTFSRYGFR